MLHEAVLVFEFADKILQYDQSGESYWEVQLTMQFISYFQKGFSEQIETNLTIKTSDKKERRFDPFSSYIVVYTVVLSFESVDEIL